MRRMLLEGSLFARFDPPPGRNFMGYLIALAAANRVSPQQLLYKASKALELPGPQLGQALSRLTGSRVEVLEPLLCVGARRGRWSLVPGHQVKRSLGAAGIRVCPECASTEFSPEAAVSLSLYVGCSRHRTALVSRCGDCGRRLLFARPSWRRCVCGADLAGLAAESLDADVAKLMTWIREACVPGHGARSRAASPGELALPELLRLILLVGGSDDDRWRGNSATVGPNRPELVVARAAPLLADWPRSFAAFVRALVVDGAHSEGSEGFGRRLMKSINVIDASRPSPMEGMVLDAVLDAVNGERYSRLDPRVVHAAPSSSTRFVPAYEAARILGVADNALVRASRFYAVPTQPVTRGTRNVEAYNVAALRVAAERRRADLERLPFFAPAPAMARTLGVGRASVAELAELGCLETLRLPECVLYSLADGRSLIEGFEARSVGNQTSVGDLRIAVCATRWRHLTVGRIVRAVIDGKVPVSKPLVPVGMHRGRDVPKGLNEFALDAVAVRALARLSCPYLLPKDVAEELGVPYELVGAMVEQGYLDAGPTKPFGRKVMNTVTVASADAFARKFTHTLEVRASLDGEGRVGKMLRALGVPEAGRLSKLVAVYERTAVARVLGWDASATG
ncbi:TniQ family protein [Aureimonas sp. ME7]|uniref:TniQ family protein n=1 Tax=Aureimonas sp. ME7 TaxID=2744252 RepID=UPI0015F47EBF|nr:TniQ family protein [Aureimonas sp. ME7]